MIFKLIETVEKYPHKFKEIFTYLILFIGICIGFGIRTLMTADTIDALENNTAKAQNNSASVQGDGNVLSQNQSGGQTANNIHNETYLIGSSKRKLPQSVKEALKVRLSKYSNKKVSLRIANNEMQSNEPVNFAKELQNVFISSGWSADLSNSGNMIANGAMPNGIIIQAIGESNSPIANLIYEQFQLLQYRTSIKDSSKSNEGYDLYIEVWTK